MSKNYKFRSKKTTNLGPCLLVLLTSGFDTAAVAANEEETVSTPSKAGVPAQRSGTQPSGTAQPKANEGSVSLGTVEVSDSQTRSRYQAEQEQRQRYYIPRSTTATKTDTPIMETPMSIQVVPRQVMDDQQVIDIKDAVKNVSGVQFADDFYVNFNIRGFDTNNNIYRNGLRLTNLSALETANLSQVEILKGPAAVLFGRLQPGGLVNLVTKRPLDQPYYSVQQQFGSYNLYRTTVDATGPVLDDGTLLYRANIAYRTNDSFRDFVSQENLLVAPSLTWRPIDPLEVNLDFEYQHYNFVQDGGIPAVGNRPAQIPISRYLDDRWTQYNPSTQDRYLVGMDWTFKFNEDWHITNRFLYNSADYYQPMLWHSNMENDQFLVRGLDNHVKQNRSTYTTNLDLVGKFATGIARHEVLVGFDFFQFNQSSGNSYSDYSPLVPPIDIYSPDNSLVVANTDAIKQLPNNFFYKQDETWYGIYFQDQITLWDKLHILGGGRYNWAEYSTGFSNLSFGNIQMTPVNDDAFNPRVGVLYQPWSWLSVYGNYVESFGTPNGGQSASGQPFSPETAQQGEVGIKTEWFDQRLNATLAFYDITKRNILTPDPNDIRFSVSVGEARSRGVELDFTGKLTQNWSLLGSYAYTDAKITKDNSGNEGNQLMGVPLNSGNLWTKYEFDAGVLEGLSIGTGVFARGQRQGDNANSFQLPGFTRWDASIAYSFKQLGSKVTTQFNVYNLLDKTYYTSSNSPVGITPGQPITFLGSVRVEF